MSAASTFKITQSFPSSTVSFSPGTTFIATAHLNRIVVRLTSTLAVVRTWLCVSSSSSSSRDTESVNELLWSSDSLYLLAFSEKGNAIWVFALTENGGGEAGELARMGGEGVEGVMSVAWGKYGREILAWSDYGLRLTIYDLSTGNARYIQHPKSPHNCHTYSPDGRYLAVAERHDGKDFIGVYDAAARYALVRHFALQTTDVHGILWSPCGKYIAAWDTPLLYSLHVHSPLSPHLTHFSPSSTTFAQDEDPGTGIRTVVWAPGGRWVALGGWDGRVRIIESDGWRCVATLRWAAKTTEKDVTISKEPNGWLRGIRRHGVVQFDRLSVPASLPTVPPDLTKFPPRAGISEISFDVEATTFLVRVEHQPNVVHLHTFLPSPITHLASLIFTSPVRSAYWCPRGKRVVISTNTAAIYIWDGEGGWVEDGKEVKGGIMEGISMTTIGSDIYARDAQWSPDGNALAILDKHQFCVLHEPDSEGLSKGWEGLEEGLTRVMEEDEGMSIMSGAHQWGLVGA
ncbi:MAG: hypothetical protein TREMPRED_002234 [Tremellales sp. Tagirdzhanova-0007]|nr:MAG: hypothetical protein TREMPRED_002234 [Tremellales sp. Tagirdzhanova-0007]